MSLLDEIVRASRNAHLDMSHAAPVAAAGTLGALMASQSNDADAGVISKAGRQMIEAWHGSPHKFDRFSMDKIGTGEGAQAYGHGLYFADSEDVARGYRDALADLTVDGKPLTSDEYAIDGLDNLAALALRARNGNIDEAIKYADESISPEIGDQLRAFDRSRIAKGDGALYRTYIDVDPDTLLDWDKPLSEQSEAVKQALQEYSNLDWPITKLQGRIRLSDGRLADTEADLSTAFRERGIPGIRYLDGNSRSSVTTWDGATDVTEYHPLAKGVAENYLDSAGNDVAQAVRKLRADATASGAQQYTDAANALESGALKPSATSNYVMFDDKPISIVERGAADPRLLAATATGTLGALTAHNAATQYAQSHGEGGTLLQALANVAESTARDVAGYGQQMFTGDTDRTRQIQQPAVPISPVLQRLAQPAGRAINAALDYDPPLAPPVRDQLGAAAGVASNIWEALSQHMSEKQRNRIVGAGMTALSLLDFLPGAAPARAAKAVP